MKPRILDLYAGAGGAARGYQLAGFVVTGVDINPQPRYAGDHFIQGDAIEHLKAHGHEYDAVHASPPCQADCTLTAGTNQGRRYPNLTADTRNALIANGRPYVIENPPGRTVIRRDLVLCGEMFGLDVIRHRVFELGGWAMLQPAHVKHRGRVAGWRHGRYYDGPYVAVYGDGGGKGSVADWQRALGIGWTDDKRELAEAIPPVYTHHLGVQLMAALDQAEKETRC